MEYAIAPLISLVLLSSISMAQIDASGYVEVDGSKIFYESTGEGPILILIHDGLVLVGSVGGGFPLTTHLFERGGHSPTEFKTDEEQLLYYAQDDPYEIYRANKEATKKVTQLVKENPPKEIGSSPPPPGEPAYRRLSEIEVPALFNSVLEESLDKAVQE